MSTTITMERADLESVLILLEGLAGTIDDIFDDSPVAATIDRMLAKRTGGVWGTSAGLFTRLQEVMERPGDE